MKLYLEEGQSIPAFQILSDADAAPIGYTETARIEDWHTYGIHLVGNVSGFMDWKCLQSEIEQTADDLTSGDYDANWGALSTSEQELVCRYVLTNVSGNKFVATFPDEIERMQIQLAYDEQSTDARIRRYRQMRMHLFAKIGTANSLQVLKDVVKESLVELFEGGIKSVSTSGVVGVNDFILSTSGTPYDGTGTIDGLTLRGYSVIDGSGDTIADVANQLVDIVDHGNY